MPIALRTLSLLLAISIAACASSTPTTTVNRLLAEPGRYANDDVWVRGNVVRSASVLGRGAYQIDDGTGTLWVISNQGLGVPRKDARVRVRGTLRDAYDLSSVFDLPDEIASGIVLVEREHRADD
jgi:hypothetical protein